MAERGKKTVSGSTIVSFFLFIFSLFGFLGIFDITIVGTKIFGFLILILGGFAWLGPIVGLMLSLYLWIRSGSSTGKSSPKNRNSSYKKIHKEKVSKTKKNSFTNKGVPLPPTKLVIVEGFNKYFSNPDWVEFEASATAQELADLGTDFKSYFNEGQDFPLKLSQKKFGSVQGFDNYFSRQLEVVEEPHNQRPSSVETKKSSVQSIVTGIISSEINNKQEKDYSVKGGYPGQVARLINREPNDSSYSYSRVDNLGADRELSQGVSESYSDIDIEESPKGESTGISWEEREVLIGKPVVTDKEPVKKINTTANELKDVDEPILNQMDRLSRAGNSLKKDEFTQTTQAQPQTAQVQPEESEITVKNSLVNQNSNLKLDWDFPAYTLLEPVPNLPFVPETETQRQLEKVLQDFGVQAKVIRVTRGPVITRYELAPAPGVKISRIVNLADDIALALAARDVRIEAPIPGKAAIGIEVPNKHPRAVPFREVLETPDFKQVQSKLKVALGKDISNYPVIADLSKMPHLLVAGATGSGKSVCVTSIINSILFNASPNEVKFLMIDPKMVELNLYNGIPHLLAPVVTDPKKAATALKWVVKEMETRYELFAAAGVRDIIRYNQVKATEPSTVPAMPSVVVIIDELADLMIVAADDVEEAICRLAQMARAAGIHLVIATQRPSVDVITGVIKANIPSRISFAVTSQIDSRTILDSTGAEKLLGKGDMLYSPQGLNKPVRVQGCLVTDEEVNRVISHWKAQGRPEYLDPEGLFSEPTSSRTDSGGLEDEMFNSAAELVISTGMGSVSFLQRKLKLGYSRAARLMDMLEEHGIVGPYEGSKPRQVLISLEEFQERFS